MIAYRATLDVPRELVLFLAGLLRAERRRRGTRNGTRWRTLQHITASPSRIGDLAKAALVLIHFEHGRLA